MPDENGKLTPDELKARWETTPGKEFREEILRQLKSEENEYSVDWENLEVNIEGKPFLWKDFIGISELEELQYYPRDLRGVDFTLQRLKHANFVCAILEHANLRHTDLEYADFTGASLKHACLVAAHLEYSDFTGAHLERAVLWHSYLIEAKLDFAYLEHAILVSANLEKAQLYGTDFLFKSFWWRIRAIFAKSWKKAPDRPTILTGASLKNVKLDSDPILYRDLLDEQYLDSFAEKHPVIYFLWLISSNCGRSVSLLFAWTLIAGFFFGFVFADISCPIRVQEHVKLLANILDLIDPHFTYNSMPETTILQPLYLSFVTMTTLGVASAEPVNAAAYVWHTIQNLVGYVLLGYLVAVLGSKLTRRSA